MQSNPPAGDLRLPLYERIVPRQSRRRHRQSTARLPRSAWRAAGAITRAVAENGTIFLQGQGDGPKLKPELFSLANQDSIVQKSGRWYDRLEYA